MEQYIKDHPDSLAPPPTEPTEPQNGSGTYGGTGGGGGPWYRRHLTHVYKHHTGGIVEGAIPLKSTEVFSKLLKGEFVSTPAQMKRFVEETLPQIAGYTSSSRNNEFNAPLVEIKCESVTSESLPELERVVNEAVAEIKRELDSGMSRTGYKRPLKKRLT